MHYDFVCFLFLSFKPLTTNVLLLLCKSIDWFLYERDMVVKGLIRIKCIEMLHLLETQAGDFFEVRDIYVHRRYILYKYYTLHKGFYKQKVTAHSYLMVFIWTLKDARCKMEIWGTSVSQKRPVQAELVLSLRKVTLRAQWKIISCWTCKWIKCIFFVFILLS